MGPINSHFTAFLEKVDRYDYTIEAHKIEKKLITLNKLSKPYRQTKETVCTLQMKALQESDFL